MRQHTKRSHIKVKCFSYQLFCLFFYKIALGASWHFFPTIRGSVISKVENFQTVPAYSLQTFLKIAHYHTSFQSNTWQYVFSSGLVVMIRFYKNDLLYCTVFFILPLQLDHYPNLLNCVHLASMKRQFLKISFIVAYKVMGPIRHFHKCFFLFVSLPHCLSLF